MNSCCAGAPSNLGLSRTLPMAKKAFGQSVTQAPLEFISVSAGSYALGSADHDANPLDREGPIREVWLEAFQVSATPVTNAQFAEFVAATDYQTEAEQIGWSFVFHLLVASDANVIGESQGARWWQGVQGASWRCPEGGSSSVSARQDHPVVHVSFQDAVSYCNWAGVELPSEAQWEAAARGGLVSNRYPWGNELLVNGQWQCNIFQGVFPEKNTVEDGFIGTSPVKSFAPNGYGGYDFAGNVWEWTSSRFDDEAKDFLLGAGETPMVTRGGSYLCHDSYCNRYRVGARNRTAASSVAGNIGFRVVRGLN
jgi:formylglycine-generating enzyme